MQLARKITMEIEGLEIPHKSSKVSQYVTASIGISVCNHEHNHESYDSLILLADKALYIAKEKGRNRYEIIDGELSDNQ